MLGIAYYRHRPLPFSNPSHLAGVTLLTLVLASTWHVYESYTKDMQRYAPRMVVQYMEAKTWWQESWQQLPAYRIDLEGEFEQPLNIQWGGTLASLCEKLRALGWHDAVPLRISTALQWLNTNAEIEELPVLPQVHDGRNEVLLLLGPQEESRVSAQATANKKQQLVLRLWKSGIVLNSITVPLWVGNVSFQEQKRILFLTLPVTTPEFDLPLEKLMMSLNGMEQRTVRHPLGAAEMKSSWSGSVLLIRDE
jgi:undecaprenyl-diphosphatase